MRFLEPSNTYRLVIYTEDGEKLKSPKILENIVVENGEGGYLYAYDHDELRDMEDDCEYKDHDPIKAMMQGVISTSFKRCGIWVEGWNIITQKTKGGRFAARKVINRWLITNYTEEQLKEHDLLDDCY